MPRISKEKREKISEQILNYLFSISPESQHTNKISAELARDEEFIKSMLQDLEKQNLVVCINLNSKGTKYIRRQRWRLSNDAYAVFKRHQEVIDKKVTPQNSSLSLQLEDDF